MQAILNSLFWSLGPVAEKELRTAARLKRTYLLRFVYILCLAVPLIFIWKSSPYSFSPQNLSAAYLVSQLSRIGTHLTVAIIWCEFIFFQMISAIIMSTSISDEIYKKTLDGLLSTPLNTTQILLGKLRGKLFHVAILLLISMPVLAIIRTFGGIPWYFLVSGITLTISASLLAGTVSLWMSVSERRSYQVSLNTFSLLAFIYLGLPLVINLLKFLLMNKISQHYFDTVLQWMIMVNPFFILGSLTDSVSGSLTMVSYASKWYYSCIFLAVLSMLFFYMALVSFRRTIRHADKKPTLSRIIGRLFGKLFSVGTTAVSRPACNARIRNVWNNPVCWKEFVTSPTKNRITRIIYTIIVIIVFASAYIICIIFKSFKYNETHAAFLGIILFVTMLEMVSQASGSIPREKEARTWPMLRTTPMSPRRIIFGKALGVMYKTSWLWGLLLFHYLIFSIFGPLEPIGIFFVLIIPPVCYYFCLGAGMLSGSLFKRTSTSSSAAITTLLAILFGLPMLFLTPTANPVILLGSTAFLNEYDQTSKETSAYFISGFFFFLLSYIILGLLFFQGSIGLAKNVKFDEKS